MIAAYRRADAGTLDLDSQITVHSRLRLRGRAGCPVRDGPIGGQRRRDLAAHGRSGRAALAGEPGHRPVGQPRDEPAARGGRARRPSRKRFEAIGATTASSPAASRTLPAAMPACRTSSPQPISPSPARAVRPSGRHVPSPARRSWPRWPPSRSTTRSRPACPRAPRSPTSPAGSPGISHDAAIVYPDDAAPYVLVMCTTSQLTEDESLALIAEAAAASWQDRHLSRRQAQPPSRRRRRQRVIS